MNGDTPEASVPQPTSGESPEDTLRRIRHDLRHALYVFDLALTLLSDAREDAARFSEVLQMLRQERETLSGLVEELLLIAKGQQ